MVRVARIVAAGLVLVLSACQPPAHSIVVAERYDAFWLWAGVTPQPALKTAQSLYILQGEVTAKTPTRLTVLRPGIPHLGTQQIWLVVRVETLRWPPEIYAGLLAQLDAWQRAGNKMAGVQIDFDARTRYLDEYAAFLRDLRRRLPRGCKLSITGLLDWSANGDPQKLATLGGTVDELVLQTYQGRHTIPGYQDYLSRLDRLAVQFRIGLVQGGEWTEPPRLRTNPNFNGYVVFLLNPADRWDGGRVKQH